MNAARERSELGSTLRVGLLVSTFVLFGAARSAAAQDRDTAGAAAAYQHAQEAALRGEHARSAELYELADRLVPASAALRSAARARLLAGQLASAAVHAEALRARDGDDPRSRELATSILAQAERELVRVAVRCQPACVISIDDAVVNPAHALDVRLYAQPGLHTFRAHFVDSSSTQQTAGLTLGVPVVLEMRPAAVASVTPSQGAPEAAPRRTTKRRLSPVFGLVTSGVTAALVGLTLWSRIDTNRARDEFVASPTRARFEAGEQKDLRTQLLLSGSVALAATSAVLLLLTDWRRPREHKVLPSSAERMARPEPTKRSRTRVSIQTGRTIGVGLSHSF